MSAPLGRLFARLLALGPVCLLVACASETATSSSIVTSAPATEPTPTAPATPAPAAPPTATTPPSAPTGTGVPTADPGSSPVPVVATKRVFVTSAAFTADLKTQGNGADGFDGADRLCSTAAAAAGLSGSFRAFLSGKHAGVDVSAPSRVAQGGAWVQLDGQLLFTDPAEMTGAPRAAIAVTEKMETLPAAPVWTATNAGTLAGPACEDASGESWSSTTAASPAATGLTTASLQWTFAAPAACTATAHLYCFEQ